MTDAATTARDRELFNRIAATYCAKDLHPSSRPARIYRLKQTIKSLGLSNDARLLEVGSGAGFAATYLRGSYGTFHGVDHAQELVDYANANNAGPGVTFQTIDVNDYTPAEPFDLAFMIGVVHHLEHPVDVLKRVKTMIKPGGWLVVNEPHPGNPFVSLARAIRKKTDAKYSADQKELSEAELRELFTQAGYTDLQVHAQGVFSTPFAEVTMGPTLLTGALSKMSCAVDSWLERLPHGVLKPVSWNLIMAGKV